VTNDDWSEWRMLEKVWPSDDTEKLTKDFLHGDRQQGFTLSSKSFQRFTCVRISDDRLRIVWTYHHSLMDGWSLPLVMDKLLAICYDEERTYSFVSFKDHVEWLSQRDLEPSREFWVTALTNLDKTVPLALPKPQSRAVQGFVNKYATLSQVISLPNLDDVCKKLAVTPSSVFRSVWAIVLQQYTRSEYVVFGSVVSGRDSGQEGMETMIGMLINTVPILTHVPMTSLVRDLIQSVHGYSTDLVHHSHCSLVDIKNWSAISGLKDIFDTLLVYENYPESNFNRNITRPFHIEPFGGDEFVDYLLTIAISPSVDGYHAMFTSKTHEVEASVMTFLIDRFVHVASKIASAEFLDETLSSLDEAPQHEKAVWLSSSFGTVAPLPYELLHHAFEERAQLNPDVRAIEFEGRWLSYGELNSQASNLAADLTELGVCAGSRVAVIMERCLEFPLGLLAALKVGSAFVPLDATFPSNRLARILTDSNVNAVITTRAHFARIQEIAQEIHVILADSSELGLVQKPFTPMQTQIATRNNEAILLFTSGSTGQPKEQKKLVKWKVREYCNF
ncbi:hypothetical protein As57867_006316, partial [Aphanomyces stellatus]